jgi:5-methyltetrahydropteroyltriglutamate--homocysteine methyltransferase
VELDVMWAAHSRGEPVDPVELGALVESATATAVAGQVRAGIDVVNDGEQGRESFFTFVRDRFDGFGAGPGEPRAFRDFVEFPSFTEMKLPRLLRDSAVSLARVPKCTGPIVWQGSAGIDGDLARFAAACEGQQVTDRFMTLPSPGIIATAMANHYYDTTDQYVDALGEALRGEYRRVVDDGLVLQIDAPDLAMERAVLFGTKPLAEFLAFARTVVTAINRAIDGLPRERIRLHVCWGNYDGPHIHDVGLDEIIDVLATTEVGSLVIALANPRHAHEVRLLADQRFRSYHIVAGVIETTHNYVEHPDVVADRIVRIVDTVGDPALVSSCTDCGFATSAGGSDVAAEVAWLKLRSLADGTALANQRLGLT